MRIDVRREDGPRTGTIRLTAHIRSREGERGVWFDVPRALEHDIALTAEPWLLLMLPLAAKTGEAIELTQPVDPLFMENVRALVRTWASWYPDLKVPALRVPTAPASPSHPRGAQFFSGGVDSWFTLLRHTESTPRFPQVGSVDDLITIWGFDIAIDQEGEFRYLEETVREVAHNFGKRSIVVATNLREHMQGAWKDVWGPRWGPLTHGTGLAIVGLLLARRHSVVRIASTHRFWEPFPYGSHPLTDTLFSTSATTFVHDHALYSRAEKIERIAESTYALSKLKVCYAEGRYRNCSQCVKCHRMLLCFDALGILNQATSFDVALYQRNRHRTFLIRNENDLVRALEVRELALAHGRNDIGDVVDESIRRSHRVGAMTAIVRPVSWRAWRAAHRRLAAGMIGA
jgi:hypothetical protein